MDVQIGVAALQGIVGPGDEVQTLLQDKLPLPALQRLANALTPIPGHDPHLVGTMLLLARRRATEKAEQETHHLLAIESAQHQAGVLMSGEQRMEGHYLGVVQHAPDGTLGLLSQAKLFDGLQLSNDNVFSFHRPFSSHHAAIPRKSM